MALGRWEIGPFWVIRAQKNAVGYELENQVPRVFLTFCPSVLREVVPEYFEVDSDSPYMLLVAPIQEKIRERPPLKIKGYLALIGSMLSDQKFPP